MDAQGGTRGAWLKWGGLIGALVVLGALAAVLVTTGKPGVSAKSTLRYEMAPLRQVDRALVKYAEERRIETGFTAVGGLALRPDGSVLVAGDSAVRTFAPDGKRAGEIRLSGPVRCVATDEAGKVYAGLRDHVEVYDAQGTPAARWDSLGEKARVTGLAVAADDVFVADSGGRVVVRCDKTGKVRNRIGARDPAKNVPGLVLPSEYLDVALGPGGLVYVNNTGRHRIEAYTVDGDLEHQWGKFSMDVDGFCGCCNPISFALRPGGGFVTSEKGIARVKLLDADGNLECIVAAPESFAEDAHGVDVALDGKGRVYVLDTGTRAVRIFSRRGEEEKK